MGKPRYMEELLKKIFLWIGAAFIMMGLLCFIGVLRPTSGSTVQEPTVNGIVFLSFGIVLFIAQCILKVNVSRKNQLHSELLISGAKVNGTVEKVCLQNYAQYGSQSPYIIFYTYTYQGKVYHHKSYLFWDKPDMMEHDPIVVYANDLGQSTIQL